MSLRKWFGVRAGTGGLLPRRRGVRQSQRRRAGRRLQVERLENRTLL
jgi:hypothetical protein